MLLMPYTIIKSRKQYSDYCARHEILAFNKHKTKAEKDELELLDLLIEKWDEAHIILQTTTDPVTLIEMLMQEHKMQAKDLATLLGVGKSLVSEILSYQKGLSKEAIRILAERFKIRQEVLNVPYALKGVGGKRLPEAA